MASRAKQDQVVVPAPLGFRQLGVGARTVIGRREHMSHLCDVDVLAPCIDEQGLIATGLLATTRCVSKEPKLGMGESGEALPLKQVIPSSRS